ncbi:hypothetical protein TWF225_004963 [Orbilia oligospora]|nr:hypothetical protein TWF225_004963 [Orbilia oligospora]KAF3264958.1 hypothetical protein TWF217_002614 [Orbilia oligospora]KAF3268257.1 hypothetical protein TWF128_008255 [Orbilia oligospora]KAF3295897.1 hypothetical protein TWF132_000445 [Orbilia oligospora]
MTAVAASPPSFHQPVPRSWTNGTASMHAQMTPDEVSRLLMPPRSKSQNAIPASQLSSTSPSTNPTSTTTNNNNNINPIAAAKQALNQLPPRPSSSASNSSSISSNSSAGTMPGSNATSTPASSNPSPNNSEPNTPINSANNTVNGGVAWAAAAGKRKTARNGVGSRESAMKNSGNASNALNAAISGNSNTGSFLMLLPLNGTFERKVIPLPFYPDVLRIGRQTNAKTIPTQSNGFFDSKVLSRQHAEVWAEKGTGRVFIRDVKSSNGTFVNGSRLSPENRDSEPHEIRAEDILELGIDIVGEDNKTIVHHKVAARVQHAGFHQMQPTGNGTNFDLNFGDIDPSVGGGLMAPPLNHVQTVSGVTSGGRGRSNSQTSRGGPMAFLPNGLVGLQRQGNQLMAGMPITIEAIAKRLNYEMQQARMQQAELKRAHDFFDMVLVQQAQNAQQQREEEEQKEANKPLVNGEPANDAPEADLSKDSPVDDSELPMPLEQIENLAQHKFSSKPPPQILSLVTVLADTKRDLEAKSLRVRELEDSLLKERSARELAEERIGRLETATFELQAAQKEKEREAKEERSRRIPDIPDVGEVLEKSPSPEPVLVDNDMQLKLDKFMADLTAAQAEIELLKQSLQKSETEKSSAQISISQIAEEKKKEEDARIRAEKALEKAKKEHKKEKEALKAPNGVAPVKSVENAVEKATNGAAPAPSKLATKDSAAQFRRDYGTPFASFIGAVVVGVAVMTVLNSWTKGEKP